MRSRSPGQALDKTAACLAAAERPCHCVEQEDGFFPFPSALASNAGRRVDQLPATGRAATYLSETPIDWSGARLLLPI